MTNLALPLDHQVHIWKIDNTLFDAHNPHLYQTLNQVERARAQALVFAKHRQAYVIHHGLLRHILARYLDCAPREIDFVYNAYGKPELQQRCDLQFNLTHSGDKALIAITQHACVGIDLENTARDISFLNIASTMFSPSEQAYLKSLELDQVPQFFYRYWTRREALLKATGIGLSLDIQALRFDHDLAFVTHGCRLQIGDLNHQQFVLKDCDSFPGYCACVARVENLGDLQFFEFHANFRSEVERGGEQE